MCSFLFQGAASQKKFNNKTSTLHFLTFGFRIFWGFWKISPTECSWHCVGNSLYLRVLPASFDFVDLVPKKVPVLLRLLPSPPMPLLSSSSLFFPPLKNLTCRHLFCQMTAVYEQTGHELKLAESFQNRNRKPVEKLDINPVSVVLFSPCLVVVSLTLCYLNARMVRLHPLQFSDSGRM